MISRWLFVGLFLACLVFVVSAQRRRYNDLPPGPYCKSRGCCPGRQDECAAPILGTLCYCDEFCNQTRVEDCCPDYWSECLGIEPEPVPTTPPPGEFKTCTYEGRNYGLGQTVKKNCNICKCEQIGNTVEFLCERNHCLMNTLLIETVNRERNYGWTATNYSKFWGKTLEEGIATRLGTLQPERFVMNMNPVRKIYNPDILPRQFDSTIEWPNYISKIQDQGDCAASWAISTAAVASDRFGILSKGQEIVKLSAQELISCDKRGQQTQNCKGGYLDRAWAFIKHRGLVDEDCFPYEGYDKECAIDIFGDLRANGCRIPANSQRTSKYVTAPAYRLGNETDIMYEIMVSGPVQATMLVNNDFFSYVGGIYEKTDIIESHKKGFLSVRIVGWGEEYTNKGYMKYWKVANSWGRDWGEDGYFRIVRGRDESEIESFVIAAWPEIARRRYPSLPVPQTPDVFK
ncbi:tubulointerstitial nephritis antigen-like [Coccinella septempunctata]|uniref:tubulointerstitial nephritis antigen-like n=1 Tax=Coccinella septempunctata TaxID=41139 RepID=UPI001D06FD48|nr:tubulointerstitial nephritis antigen-like [Coccinella septempunctata]